MVCIKHPSKFLGRIQAQDKGQVCVPHTRTKIMRDSLPLSLCFCVCLSLCLTLRTIPCSRTTIVMPSGREPRGSGWGFYVLRIAPPLGARARARALPPFRPKRHLPGKYIKHSRSNMICPLLPSTSHTKNKNSTARRTKTSRHTNYLVYMYNAAGDLCYFGRLTGAVLRRDITRFYQMNRHLRLQNRVGRGD